MDLRLNATESCEMSKKFKEPYPVKTAGSTNCDGKEHETAEMDLNGSSKTDSEDKDEDYIYQTMEIVQNEALATNGEKGGAAEAREGEKAPLKLIVRKSRIVSNNDADKMTSLLKSNGETELAKNGREEVVEKVKTNDSEVNHGLPVLAEIMDETSSEDTKDSIESKYADSPAKQESSSMTFDLPIIDPTQKPPYKGTMVPCGKLKDYLDSLLTFNRKCMLRKGREVHKIYVDMTKGETFLDDQFGYTEFGKMVLSNGSIRAGRAKNAKQIVVARETLYCSGTTACKRACGGYGVCLPGCDKTKMRGHRCSYRIKLTQRLGFVNYWFVEELGSHDQLNGKDSDFKVNSQVASMMEAERSDALSSSSSSSLKMKQNIQKSHRKLAPKPNSMERSRAKNLIADHAVSDSMVSDAQTNYHYVLGSMPNGSPHRESPNNVLQNPSLATIENFQGVSSSQTSAIDAYNSLMTASLQANGQVLPTCLQPISLNPVMQADLANYMSAMTSLGLNAAALQNGINPFLVNVKQEPNEESSSNSGLPFTPTMPVLPAHMSHPSSPIHSSRPSPSSHSPSPSRGQGQTYGNHSYRERSPLCRDQGSTNNHAHSIQKGLEIEAKIKREATNKVQAHQDTLGQVHSRIMERAKSRKSSHTMRKPQKIDYQAVDLTKSKVDNTKGSSPNSESLSIPGSQMPTVKCDPSTISSQAFQRLQTLNRVIQSDVFQNAKNQIDRKKALENGHGHYTEESALNLCVNQQKGNTSEKKSLPDQLGNSYFRLAEEWQQGRQPKHSNMEETEDLSRADKSCSLLNGHIGELSDILLNTDQLTQNEKELMGRVRQLEAHVQQLQNIVIKNSSAASGSTTSGRRKKQRELDFNKYNTRHVALKFMYLGFDYSGYAGVAPTDKTIEKVLFEALVRTRLIQSKEDSNYSRCGRTDKGVSAFCQVISIDLRSNVLSGVGVKVKEGGTAHERPGDKTQEIKYVQLLNRVLPPEIRMLAWAPVDPSFDARFSCKKRTYKYFFPKGDLDIEVMKTAAAKLVGEHDFRNFCRLNVENTTNHVRNMMSAEIGVLDQSEEGFGMCVLTIVANGFLWHQIRYIVTVLFLIGRGKEQPEVIEDLFDVEKYPKKPQYNPASEIPLCLYNAEYGDELEWIYEAGEHEYNIQYIQNLWAEQAIKTTMLKSMLSDLDKAKVETECDIAPWSDLSPPLLHQSKWIVKDTWKIYQPLMKRTVGVSVEEKVEAVKAKKLRLSCVPEDVDNVDETETMETEPSSKNTEEYSGEANSEEHSRETIEVQSGEFESAKGDGVNIKNSKCEEIEIGTEVVEK